MLTFVCALLGLSVILLVVVASPLQFAYRNPAAHIALETAESFVAFLTAYLALVRYRQSGRAAEAAAGYTFLLLGFANLMLSAAPDIFRIDEADVISTWAPLITRLVAAGTLAFAAWNLSEERRSTERSGRTLWVLGDAVATVLVTAIVVVLLRDALPPGVQTEVLPDASRPSFDSHPLVLGAQVLSMLLYAVAAAGFTVRAERRPDELVRWFAAGSALSATARLGYILYPSLYSDFVYVGDLLRLASYALFLYGVTREIYSYRTTAAEAQALRERATMARSLHDGIAQELTFIGAQTRRLLRAEPASNDLKMLASAADRAGAETRRAIAVLSRTEPVELCDDLAEVVEEVCRRVGAEADLHVDDIQVAPEAAEALVRIVREAATNAVRHGKADRVSLHLSQDDGTAIVRVSDNGQGFDPSDESSAATGFGLTFIRQRTHSIEGSLEIESSPGSGTTVEVKVPAWTERRGSGRRR